MTNQSREDADQATGLPDLPKLIFLDTNIVQNLHSFGEFIFDRVSTPDLEKKLSTLGPRVTARVAISGVTGDSERIQSHSGPKQARCAYRLGTGVGRLFRRELRPVSG